MKKRPVAVVPKRHPELKRAATIGLALFAAGVMALIYVRTL